MKYFLLNKQSTVEENVMFTAKILYEQIGDSKLHIDELFLEFIKTRYYFELKYRACFIFSVNILVHNREN